MFKKPISLKLFSDNYKRYGINNNLMMLITYYDFLAMSEAEQYEAVWKGTFLGDRIEDGCWVQCYSLNSFYVEFFYIKETKEVDRIRSFSKLAHLVPNVRQQGDGK